MVSDKHQFMVGLIARKMKLLGYTPIFIDGDQFYPTKIKCPIPPTLISHRPDIIGVNQNGDFCIGEAKTHNDIHSKRTKNQIVDFKKFGEVILCFPYDKLESITSKLNGLNMLYDRNIHLLKVPNELMPSC